MAKQKKYTTEWHRRDAVAKWRASGLSQAEFCRREGIAECSLSAWKLRDERAKSKPVRKPLPAKPASAVSAKVAEVPHANALPVADTGKEPMTASFVSVIPRRSNNSVPPACPGNPVAEITFAGSTVRVFAGTEIDTLRMLLQVLTECLPC